MREIIELCDALRAGEDDSGDRLPVKDLGFITLTETLHIRHVPFYDPCIILVLSGRKVLLSSHGPVQCDAGYTITVPAPSSFDIRNETDSLGRKYRALIIPFKPELLDRLRKTHRIDHGLLSRSISVLKFNKDDTLYSSIRHYLASVGDPMLAAHRLMEILLILVNKNPELLSYVLQNEKWSAQVRAVLAGDLAASWTLPEVCKRLATTESTLRRNLRKEQTGFRGLLYDLRLSTALYQILQTSRPVYQIAYDCGYRSASRFTNNFHKRFGLSPRQMKESSNLQAAGSKERALRQNNLKRGGKCTARTSSRT